MQKQNRTSLACSFCRKRKRKCDGGNPCSICQKYNKTGQCEYQLDKDGRKLKYDSTYVDYLEMKADILEQYASELVRNNPSKIPKKYQDTLSRASSIPKPYVETNTESLLKSLADEDAVDELTSTIWRVRLDDKGNSEFYGPISGRQQVIESTEDEDCLIPNNRWDLMESNRNFRDSLINNFKENFGKFFYVSWLSIEEIRSWNYPPADLSKQFLLYSIFTYGALFTEKRDISFFFLQQAEALTVRASKVINEEMLQGLLILSCFELGMGLDSNSWVFNAMSAALTQLMRLHLNEIPTVEPNLQLISISPKKSAMFWSVILQDRIITSVLGRGCRIQYFRINTPFYSPVSSDQSTEDYLSEVSFTLHSKLWYIHDRIIGQIYSFRAEYLHDSHRTVLLKQGVDALEEFKSSIPQALQLYDDTSDIRILTLHLSYSTIYLLLHRAYLKQMPLKVIHLSLQQCQAASELIQKCTICFENRQAPYFVSYLILTCATFELFLLSSKDDSKRKGSLERLTIYIQALLKFGKFWRRGYKDIQVLDSLARRWNLQIPLLAESLRIVEQDGRNSSVADAYGYGYDTYNAELANDLLGQFCDI